MATCAFDGNNGLNHVCNYAPAGNEPNAFGLEFRPFVRGKRGEDCGSNYDSVTGLCDCGGKVCLNGGVLDPKTCTCKCTYAGGMTLPWVSGDDCQLDCTRNPIDFPNNNCEAYDCKTTAIYDMCPIFCNLCPRVSLPAALKKKYGAKFKLVLYRQWAKYDKTLPRSYKQWRKMIEKSKLPKPDDWGPWEPFDPTEEQKRKPTKVTGKSGKITAEKYRKEKPNRKAKSTSVVTGKESSSKGRKDLSEASKKRRTAKGKKGKEGTAENRQRHVKPSERKSGHRSEEHIKWLKEVQKKWEKLVGTFSQNWNVEVNSIERHKAENEARIWRNRNLDNTNLYGEKLRTSADNSNWEIDPNSIQYRMFNEDKNNGPDADEDDVVRDTLYAQKTKIPFPLK
ncbi:uncharacterized protein LOC141909192 [Tubulanus polymorphus]|uniref:uncharacterized protein LOC141909192 n=1 Tax=Tubulanus polymorphus TaxID=672921 RepID=UPI003DA45B18